MGYNIGQYMWSNPGEIVVGSNDDIFMKPVAGGGIATTVALLKDRNVTGQGGTSFKEECVVLNQGTFDTTKSYYFHGKVKRLDTEQTIDIKLISKKDNSSDTGELEQYVTTLIIEPGTGWVDVEFVFSPLDGTFNSLMFQLARTTDDYKGTQREVWVVYLELCEIQNILNKIIGNAGLYKIGVQTRPGLFMCINGQDIRVGRTGIYEIRNEAIKVNFFSVLSAGFGPDIDAFFEQHADTHDRQYYCLFNSPKNRIVDRFTLDYMYES